MKNALVNIYVKKMYKLHDEIQNRITSGKFNEATVLLEQCQNCAILTGTMIEKRVGQGTAAVGCLEEYCEMVYLMHEKFGRNQKNGKDYIISELDTQLSVILNCVEKELDIHMEAVFLPFRADTWDALESVWQVAQEDSDCDAYVIPIPFYDKKPDGSFGTMHYEAEQFPADVPITFYENYDIAGRRPDMIFIQNPYDECNYTSSVHPYYYAKNLKQFTDKLVYIPWFTIREIGEKDEQGLQSAQYFIKVPGVMYADKVIVQSEQMRQFYINVLVDAKGKNTREEWENKIVGLGSPLYDKEGNAKKIKQVIPEEWKKLIYKSDGSRKKIILYGTSLSIFLQYKEQVLRKMNSVFEMFRENVDEEILLWRPDGRLAEEMSAVVDRELIKSYQQIVEQYQKEGWGIYDESTDLKKLVLLADAYYGDSCRMIQLSREAGIPIMLQDINIC